MNHLGGHLGSGETSLNFNSTPIANSLDNQGRSSPFSEFLFLGVVCYQADRCWLDQTKATQVFGSRIADDFGWTPEARGIPLQKVISNFINENQLDSGFVVASELRSLLLQRGFENPDREIAKLEAEGQLSIEAADYGQSRHGIGLYDDPSKQLIKLRVF
jgi:hypothetical protein